MPVPRPTPKCSLCGNPIKPPVFNTPVGALCYNCYRELEDALNEFVCDYIEAKVYGKPIPNVDEYVEKHYPKFQKLYPNKKSFKLAMLIRVIHLNMRNIF